MRRGVRQIQLWVSIGEELMTNPASEGSASSAARAERNRRGSVLILVVFAVVLLFTMVSFTVSTGEILVKKQQLQDLVDAAALAGAAALRDGGTSLQAVANAMSVSSEAGDLLSSTMGLPPEVVEIGRYDFIGRIFHSTAAGEEGVPAVRVSLPLSISLVDGDGEAAGITMSNFLRRQIGIDEIPLHAEAIAVVRPRDIVILQDITGSFQDEFEFARQADLSLVDIIAESYGGLGDQIGVVTFGRTAQTEFPLTPVAEGLDSLKFFLASTMEVCTSSSSRHRFLDRDAHRVYDPTDPDDTVGRRLRRVNCRGTGTGPAIAHAALMLDHAVARGADPVIVLVTDGVPCHVRFRRSSAEWVETGKQAAVDAALAARQRGIRIFVVDLSLPPFGPPDSCSADGSGFNTDLASHGFGTTTDDPVELENKLLEVANKLTLRLVR